VAGVGVELGAGELGAEAGQLGGEFASGLSVACAVCGAGVVVVSAEGAWGGVVEVPWLPGVDGLSAAEAVDGEACGPTAASFGPCPRVE
jgi:hypothetical protein